MESSVSDFATYLSLPTEDVLDEVHGALSVRREVHLPLLGEDVVDIKLAFNSPLQLTSSNSYLSGLSIGLVMATYTTTVSGILLVIETVGICPFVLARTRSLDRCFSPIESLVVVPLLRVGMLPHAGLLLLLFDLVNQSLRTVTCFIQVHLFLHQIGRVIGELVHLIKPVPCTDLPTEGSVLQG